MQSSLSQTVSTLSNAQRVVLIAVRAANTLAISLWLGGMGFFGAMAAPVMFKLAREQGVPTIAPQMVGAMLGRFGVLTTICGVLLLICWGVDGRITGAQQSRLWKWQGAISLLCLGLSVYLNSVLLPRTQREQDAILPIIARAEAKQPLTPAETEKRARFDAGHKAYQQLAMVNLYLVLALLVILVARGVPAKLKGT